MPENNLYQQWQQRTDQDNLQRNRDWLIQHTARLDQASAEQRLVFSHIPKNAGTTLEYILGKNFQLSEILHVNAPDLNKQPNLLQLKKNQPRLICGHHPMHGLLYQLLPDEPMVHITMLRNPLDRVISYYNYIHGSTRHPLHDLVKDMDFDEFIEHPELTEIRNGQAKRLAGYLHSKDAYDEEQLYTTAKQILQQCFTVVLITEQFDQGLLVLQTMLNLQDLYYLPHNQSKKLIDKTAITAQQQALIVQHNAVDDRLYRHFQQQFTQLYQQRVDTNALSLFEQRQQQWRALQQP